MKNNWINDPLEEFNQLCKKINESYHLYAKKLGISDMTLWLLYSLYESNAAYTQRELCTIWHYPPQTVNSALKNLEKQGIITLKHISGNLKNKQIVLTEKGEEYTQKIISPLVFAERRTFQGLEDEERDALLSTTRKYADILQIEVSGI